MWLPYIFVKFVPFVVFLSVSSFLLYLPLLTTSLPCPLYPVPISAVLFLLCEICSHSVACSVCVLRHVCMLGGQSLQC